MTNIPTSLTDSSLTLFNLTISASDPWPFSLVFL
ncbi:auxin-responsive protein SAUR32-like [Senna tora]|uniref:Auxin-responsive protein SAUR32-like n=1 Tax=Senna tora TaxID=362788 RepID=A0A834T7J0_9FABA|nr:auxin-responsive protein SAUR32-like [Senna tora]